MRLLIVLSMLIGSFSAGATVGDGGSVGNGGHPYGLEFLRIAVKVVADISKEKEKFREVNIEHLNNIINDKNLKVIVDNKELWVHDGKKNIRVSVRNIPEENKIEIHDLDWEKVSKDEKPRLVFHEILGLAGLEKTGDYHISKRYQEKKESGYTEAVITKMPLPLIPSKAVSCYSLKITSSNQTPERDIDADYFSIPIISFFRSNAEKDLIISNIRITYAIPGAPGQSPAIGKCEIAGDPLRALSSQWWQGGPEAVIPANDGQGGDIFATDCAAYCGGIKAVSDTFTTTGDVEIFGIERDPKTGDEIPVRMTRIITIRNY